MNFKKYACILLFLTIHSLLHAQELSNKFLQKSFQKGSIVLNNYTKVYTNKLTFRKDSILFVNEKNQVQSIPYNMLRYARFKKGNYLIRGAITGFFVGGLTGVAGVLPYNNAQANDYVISGSAGCIIGFTIGATIGLFVPKMETLFFKQEENSHSLQFKLSPKNYNTIQFSICYRF